jgi:hypothetical protein
VSVMRARNEPTERHTISISEREAGKEGGREAGKEGKGEGRSLRKCSGPGMLRLALP